MVTIKNGTLLLVWDGATASPAIAWHDFEAEVTYFAMDDQEAEVVVSATDAEGHVAFLAAEI